MIYHHFALQPENLTFYTLMDHFLERLHVSAGLELL